MLVTLYYQCVSVFCRWASASEGEQLPECSEGLQPKRHLQEIPLGLHKPLHEPRLNCRSLQQAQMPQGPAAVLRQGAAQAQLRHALLLLSSRRSVGLLRAQTTDHRAGLFVWRQREAQLPGTASLMQDQLHLQVKTAILLFLVIQHGFS